MYPVVFFLHKIKLPQIEINTYFSQFIWQRRATIISTLKLKLSTTKQAVKKPHLIKFDLDGQ